MHTCHRHSASDRLHEQDAPFAALRPDFCLEISTCQRVVLVADVWYQPPGCEKPLLQAVDLTLPANSMGLVYGRSGSGKTTLLTLLAGLRQQTTGSVSISSAAGVFLAYRLPVKLP